MMYMQDHNLRMLHWQLLLPRQSSACRGAPIKLYTLTLPIYTSI
jgi:hypothetical protein